MLGMKLDQAKAYFFDRGKVLASLDRAHRQALSRFGAFVRQRARTSIRQAPKVDSRTGLRLGPGRRKKGTPTHDAISNAGDPPFSHVGFLKRFILFSYDPVPRSVVIGPTPFGRGEAPEALEYGGQVTVTIGPKRQSKRATVRPRPFMQPAFAKELQTAPSLYRDSMR